jgi:hypothetical protein
MATLLRIWRPKNCGQNVNALAYLTHLCLQNNFDANVIEAHRLEGIAKCPSSIECSVTCETKYILPQVT